MEELLAYIEQRKDECLKEIQSSSLSSYDEIMRCHSLANKVGTYNEIVKFINDLHNKR